MKKPTIVLSTVILATLISSGKTFAQNLPDEINHPQYLRVYQNLEQVLQTKTAELNKLMSDKAAIEAEILQMEKGQRELPARNDQLRRLIQSKMQELAKLNSDIAAMDSVLGQVGVDLNNLDAVISQLSNDLRNQNASAQQLDNQRRNLLQTINQIDARLQRELRDEDQSVRIVNGLRNVISVSSQKIADLDQDKRAITRDVDLARRDLPRVKSDLSKETASLNEKRPKLKEAQDKIAPVKAEIASEKTKLTQVDGQLAPLNTKLAQLKAELERLSPEIRKLEKDNKDLRDKIKASKDKISAVGLEALKLKVTTIENEIASLESQAQTARDNLISAQEAIKPDLAQLNDLKERIRVLSAAGTSPELLRLKNEERAMEKRIAPKKLQIAEFDREVERIALAMAPKQSQLNTAKQNVTSAEKTIDGLNSEIGASESKIAANDAVIAQQTQANSGVANQITEAEAAIKPLQESRNKIQVIITNLEKQEVTLNGQVVALSAEIKRLETNVTALTVQLASMEKTISDAPQEMRRIDAHIRQLSELVAQKRPELAREENMLQRITRDRLVVQREMDLAQRDLGIVTENLRDTQTLMGVLNEKISNESRKRDALVRYNQDSIGKRDALKAAKANADRDMKGASEEVTVNEQDLQTISRQLPIKKSDLNTLNSRTNAAIASVSEAQRKTNEAEGQFQIRLSMFETQLANAKSLGAEKAQIGSADGAKLGSIDAKGKATKLASENAAAEAKWEALRRGYIRGEIAGFVTGRDIGLSSLPEATRGENEGKTAGALRAKNQAELVLKPVFYIEELDRRLKEDVITRKSKSTLAAATSDAVSTSQSSAEKSMRANDDIPELTQDEINASARIISALDSLIDQSVGELRTILANRNRISQAGSVYSMPGQGTNAATVNCTAVYKSVKEFVDACKAEYTARYQGLFENAHRSSFMSEYPQAFRSQVDNVFDAELSRLYPTYLKEATNVGKDVGINAGKQEIFRQNFEKAELISYNARLPIEEDRVENEASTLVNEYINTNGVLTINSTAKLEKEGALVIPGETVALSLEVKNIGAVPSSGTSLVKVLKASSNVVIPTREASLGVVNARSVAKLSALNVTISDNAVPGESVTISGEVVHPGNKYRATRVEKFNVEKVIGVNPAVESGVGIDVSPKVNNVFGIKKHDVEVIITPKFNGVPQGYEIILEEIASKFVEILTGPVTTSSLRRGDSKKAVFTYKLSKASKGKTVTLRVTIKNGGSIVKTNEYQIRPH